MVSRPQSSHHSLKNVSVQTTASKHKLYRARTYVWIKQMYLIFCAYITLLIDRVGNPWSAPAAPASPAPGPGLDPPSVCTDRCGKPQRGQQQPGQRGVQLRNPPRGLPPPEQPWVRGTARKLHRGPHGHEPV